MENKAIAQLTECSRAMGGFVITWRAETPFLWQCVAARIRQLPQRYWHHERSINVWWLDNEALPWLREVFSNYDQALGAAWGLPVREIAHPSPHVVRAFRALYLTPDAPPDCVKACYRALRKRSAVAQDVTTAQLGKWEQARAVALAWAEEHHASAVA